VSEIINRLKELNVEEEDFIVMKFEDTIPVFFTYENHTEKAAERALTSNMLANILSSGIPLYFVEEEDPEKGVDILSNMRAEGLLDEYDRDFWFEEFLQERLVESIYDQEYCLFYNTRRWDHKRGESTIYTEFKVRASDLYNFSGDYPKSPIDTYIDGFELIVQTSAGEVTVSY